MTVKVQENGRLTRTSLPSLLKKIDGEPVEWRDAARFEALADYVLIACRSFDQTTGGIYRPENSTEDSTRTGVVISVGPGHSNLVGGFVETQLQVGDLVVGSFADPEMHVDHWQEGEHKFYVCREGKITGRVRVSP
jgi:co-chaperonin GroES (HSP10)